MRLLEIAQKLGCELDGDGSVEITDVKGLDEAGVGDLTFLSNPKYAAKVKNTKASAIIVSLDGPVLSIPALRTTNPYLAFAHSLELFYAAPDIKPGIHPSAVISPSAKIGKNPSIGAWVSIGDDVVIGDNATLLPQVVIYRGVRIGNNFLSHSQVSIREYTEIGNDVILQNGVVIGADGFGFAKQEDGSYYKIRQCGKVVLEDGVEIQANSTIDRAAIGETRICRGVKIDNLVQIGHGSRVGENSLLCSQVGLAGSTEIGKSVVLTGQVGVAGHCRIGDNVVATAQSGIPSDVEQGSLVSGYPAIDNKLWLKCSVLFSKLPEINKSLRDIKLKVESILNQGS
jgi:UDP-3-O-[3-hydroxymyristoyl] glucosamine N-acyltransferase